MPSSEVFNLDDHIDRSMAWSHNDLHCVWLESLAILDDGGGPRRTYPYRLVLTEFRSWQFVAWEDGGARGRSWADDPPRLITRQPAGVATAVAAYLARIETLTKRVRVSMSTASAAEYEIHRSNLNLLLRNPQNLANAHPTLAAVCSMLRDGMSLQEADLMAALMTS